jgi:hypothetical protein
LQTNPGMREEGSLHNSCDARQWSKATTQEGITAQFLLSKEQGHILARAREPQHFSGRILSSNLPVRALRNFPPSSYLPLAFVFSFPVPTLPASKNPLSHLLDLSLNPPLKVHFPGSHFQRFPSPSSSLRCIYELSFPGIPLLQRLFFHLLFSHLALLGTPC